MKFITAVSLALFLQSCADDSGSKNSYKAPRKTADAATGESPSATPAMPQQPGQAPAVGPSPAGPIQAVTLNIAEKPPLILPDTLAELNIFVGKTINPEIPFVSYDVNSALWSDGAIKTRYLLLPKGTMLAANPITSNIEFPVGTIIVKHFVSDQANKTPVETRIMLKKPNLTWDYAGYKWNTDGTTKRVWAAEPIMGNADWPMGYRIPAENECMKCHNPNVLDVLGFRPEQLKGVLEKLAMSNAVVPEALAVFAKAVPQADAKNTALTPEVRAKAYLQVNCVPCHQPSGLKSSLSLSAKSLDWAAMLKAPATVADPMYDVPVITPGKPELSKLYLRFTAPAGGKVKRMPSVSVYQDPVGEEVIKAWIMSIPATCTVANTATCATAPAAPIAPMK